MYRLQGWCCYRGGGDVGFAVLVFLERHVPFVACGCASRHSRMRLSGGYFFAGSVRRLRMGRLRFMLGRLLAIVGWSQAGE
ncbi:MAG: hypothetical protein WCA56_01190 [Xanthobacteraceae bacterium]